MYLLFILLYQNILVREAEFGFWDIWVLESGLRVLVTLLISLKTVIVFGG